MNTLKIATWNIDGLSAKIKEAEVLINEHKLDILLISETHLTNKNQIRIPNYNIYTTNHPDGTAHGGTAVIIRSSISHHELPHFRSHHIQATTISVQDKNGNFNVSSVYCQPKPKINKDMFSQFFQTLGKRFIAGGDWNAKHIHWGSRLTTTRGKELKACLDMKHLVTLSTAEPTHWPGDPKKLPDTIDFFITAGLSRLNFQIESCLDGSSNHVPVILTMSALVMHRENRNYIYNKHTDWNSFRDLVETKLDLKICLKTPDDIEDAALNFFHIIQEACWMCTPYHVTTQKNKPVPQEIRAKILEKRKLRRIWQTSRHPADKSKLNKAIVELKQIIQNCSNELLQTQLEGLSATKSTNYSLWKVTKQHDRPQKSKPPLKHSTLGWVRSSQEKAEAFAKHLAVVFTPNAASSDSEDKDINLVMSQDFQLDMPLKHTSPKEIAQQIYRLENGKSPGFDKIDKKILTELPRKGIIYLTALFNAVIRTGYFPSVWKIAEITMIHKDGKPPNEITSYRPISLLPVVSKLFEKVILRRITPVLTERSVIPKHQFGFRKQHATTEQVHRVCSTIRCALEEKEYCAAAFLDVQQAFDRVWHTGLLCKIKMLLPHSFFHIIKSYIEDRIFYVKEEDSMSQFYEINAGVPQGSVLGPILYSIFTSDLPQSKGVTTATYADDTAILASDKIPEKASLNLQESLNDIHKWLEKWRIRASATKSVQITFTLRKGNCPPVKLGETELPHHDTVKYLGMHLDRRLTWQKHLKTKRDEINLKYRNLNWLLGRNSRLSVENKLLVYKTVLKPVWSYGIQLWGSAAISNVNIIQRVQNAILRAIGKAPWFIRISELHEHLGIPTVAEEIRTQAGSYRNRLCNHPNELAAQLTTPNFQRRLKRREPMELAHS